MLGPPDPVAAGDAARSRTVGLMTAPSPYQRILVPLDGSDVAVRAVRQAQRLALLFGARLWIVTVDDPGDDRDTESILAEGVDAAGPLPVDTQRVDGGDPHVVIAELNDTHPDALCCMSTTGRGPLGRAVLGSVTRAVVDHSTEPVVVVGPACREGRDTIDRVTVALDGSAESETAVVWAAQWAHAADVPLDLIRVVHPLPEPAARVQPTEGQLDDLRYVHVVAADLDEPERVHSVNLAAAEPVEALSRHLEDFDGSLLAMATRPADVLAELVAGGVGSELIRRSPAPVALTSRSDRRR